jgi:hypothetical protein
MGSVIARDNQGAGGPGSASQRGGLRAFRGAERHGARAVGNQALLKNGRWTKRDQAQGLPRTYRHVGKV